MTAGKISLWFRRQLSNPQVVILGLIILIVTGVIYFFGAMLAPLLAAIVIAYLLEGLVERLERRKFPHLAAVLIVFLSFFTFLIFAAFGLLPLLIRQLGQLAQQVAEHSGRAAGAAGDATGSFFVDHRTAGAGSGDRDQR